MKVVGEKDLIYLQWYICEQWRRQECSNRLGLSAEALNSDLWVSGGCVNGLSLWSISIPGVEPHTWDGYAPWQPLRATQHIITLTPFWMYINTGPNVSLS